MNFNEDFINRALRKISGHKDSDYYKFCEAGDITLDDVKNKIIEQKQLCYYCKETVLISNWQPYCWYQFTIDRLDDDLPHDNNNCVISCYYCNCS